MLAKQEQRDKTGRENCTSQGLLRAKMSNITEISTAESGKMSKAEPVLTVGHNSCIRSVRYVVYGLLADIWGGGGDCWSIYLHAGPLTQSFLPFLDIVCAEYHGTRWPLPDMY